MSRYICKILDSTEYNKWDQFISSSPHGSVYSKSFWLQTISEVLNYKHDIVVVYKNDDIVAGIGVFHKYKMMRIPTLTPYLSPLLRVRDTKYQSKIYEESNELLKILADFLKKQYKRAALSTVSLIDNVRPFIWSGYTTEVRYTFINDIENISSAIFSHSIRKQIRKCEESDIRIINKMDPEKFWQIYNLTNEKKKHPLSIGKNAFYKLCKNISSNNSGEMFFALINDQYVSARISLYTESNTVHDWVAVSNPDYLKTGATSYLLYNIMKHFSKQGFKYFDWNGANIESIARFKGNFGGTLTPFYYITWAKLSVQLLLNARQLTQKGLKKLKIKRPI